MQSSPTSELSDGPAMGCPESFACLAARMQPKLVSFLFKRMGQLQDAEDVAAEAILKAWQNRDKYDAQFQFSTWVYSIAKRTAVDHHRKQSRRETKSLKQSASAEVLAGAAAESKVSTGGPASNIWAVAECVLSTDQYSALWLKYAEDMNVAEIASVLSKSQVGIRVLLHRGRAKLEKKLGRQSRDEAQR